MEYITREVVPCIDFVFEENELYHIKVLFHNFPFFFFITNSLIQTLAHVMQLSDNTQPDSTISCKCAVAKDTNQLELLKASLLPYG